MKFVLKRDSKLEAFDQERITEAIWKAAKAVGGRDKEQARRLSNLVVADLQAQSHTIFSGLFNTNSQKKDKLALTTQKRLRG
jgi:transcriptional regulator NrdR family protein